MTVPIIAIVLAVAPQLSAVAPAPDFAHVSNSFHLELHAPFAQVAPLFGPDAERAWAGKHWNPAFIYPQPGKDVRGAVFTVQHGPHTSVWVNTLFDVQNGRMQYVYFIPDKLVTTIDVKLTSMDAKTTAVDVTYARTALQSVMNEDVRAMGDEDRDSGPHWQQSIEAFLGQKP